MVGQTVGEVVESLMRLIRCRHASGEVVNIGNDSEISISELAHLVRRVTGSESEIEYVPYEVAYGPGFEDMQRRVPSLEKLERLVGYRPSMTIEAIVELLAGEFRPQIAEAHAAELAVAV